MCFAIFSFDFYISSSINKEGYNKGLYVWKEQVLDKAPERSELDVTRTTILCSGV